MMINDTKYRLLSILLIMPLFLPPAGGGSILSVLDTKALLGSILGEKQPIVEVDTRNQELVALIDRIEACECAKFQDGTCKADHQNMDCGSWSYGTMQWKLRTFEGALKELGLYVGQTDDEMRAMMKDREKAKEIAYKWTELNPENLHDWVCYGIVTD
jgi:hypothetical protein